MCRLSRDEHGEGNRRPSSAEGAPLAHGQNMPEPCTISLQQMPLSPQPSCESWQCGKKAVQMFEPFRELLELRKPAPRSEPSHSTQVLVFLIRFGFRFAFRPCMSRSKGCRARVFLRLAVVKSAAYGASCTVCCWVEGALVLKSSGQTVSIH